MKSRAKVAHPISQVAQRSNRGEAEATAFQMLPPNAVLRRRHRTHARGLPRSSSEFLDTSAANALVDRFDTGQILRPAKCSDLLIRYERATCGLTPIRRHGVKTANESLVVLATIVSISPAPSPGTRPFLRRTGCEPNRAKHPSSSSTMPTAHAPWWSCHPRRTLVPRRVQELLTVQWLPTAWHQSRVGSRRRRPGFDKQGRRSSVHSVWWFTSS